MKFQGFIGQAYTLPNLNVDCQALVNMYAEVIESGSGKEAQVAFLKRTPGLLKLFEVGSSKMRLIHFDGLENDDGTYFQRNRIFFVSGAEVYRLTYDPVSGWDRLLLGTLGTTEGPVSAASLSQNYGATVFVDGSDENYVYLKTDASTETFETFTAAGYAPVERATQVIWLDGYLIFMIADTNIFYVSEWANLTVSALSFASAEGDPDNIVRMITNHRDLWLLNERSVEIFSNTGNADFPFERMQGGFIENGCLAALSVAKISGTVLWLGRDASGQGIVNAATGASHVRVSTHAIEQEFATYADPDEATAYTYQSGGHSFYVINFAEATWCYDITTKMWHQRGYLEDGEIIRHRADTHVFFPTLNIHILGDFENSNIYKFDDDTFTDNLAPIKRLRSSPHISKDLKMIFYDKFQLDLKTGIGLDGAITTQGYDPQICLRYSDDGGYTWSNEIWVSMGKIGERKTRAIWRRLGKARDRVFEVSTTEPVDVSMLSADLDFTLGSN